jgi:hypothetical protein
MQHTGPVLVGEPPWISSAQPHTTCATVTSFDRWLCSWSIRAQLARAGSAPRVARSASTCQRTTCRLDHVEEPHAACTITTTCCRQQLSQSARVRILLCVRQRVSAVSPVAPGTGSSQWKLFKTSDILGLWRLIVCSTYSFEQRFIFAVHQAHRPSHARVVSASTNSILSQLREQAK